MNTTKIGLFIQVAINLPSCTAVIVPFLWQNEAILKVILAMSLRKVHNGDHGLMMNTQCIPISSCADTSVTVMIISCYITEKDEEKRRVEKMRKTQEKQERKQRKLREKGDHNQCLLLLFSAVLFWLCGFI